MVCSVPADESEYLLTEDQLAITQTEERSVNTCSRRTSWPSLKPKSGALARPCSSASTRPAHLWLLVTWNANGFLWRLPPPVARSNLGRDVKKEGGFSHGQWPPRWIAYIQCIFNGTWCIRACLDLDSFSFFPPPFFFSRSYRCFHLSKSTIDPRDHFVATVWVPVTISNPNHKCM